MKIYTIFFVLVLMTSTCFSQIPNPGFENWTNGEPDGWQTVNVPTVAVPITQTSDAHSGNYALKGEVVSAISVLMNPIILAGNDGAGFAINQRYTKASGYYKFSTTHNDQFGLNFLMYKQGQPIGVGAAKLLSSSAYTKFEVSFNYLSTETPDTCVMQFLIIGASTGSDYKIGSIYQIDDLTLSDVAVGINDKMPLPAKFNLSQNYPNPFNPTTTIAFSLPEKTNATLKLYNIFGEEVATIFTGVKEAGFHKFNFTAENLASGVYLYKLNAGNYTSTKKMIYLK